MMGMQLLKGERFTRMAEVQDRIKDLSDQIGFKEKRREGASAIRNYKECDTLTEQMSALKREKRQLEVELSSLTKKQSKSAWYHKKKRGFYSSDASSALDFLDRTFHHHPLLGRKISLHAHHPLRAVVSLLCLQTYLGQLLLHAAAFLLHSLLVNTNVHMIVTPLSFPQMVIRILLINHFHLFPTPLRLSGGVSQLYTTLQPMLKSCQLASLRQVTSIFSKASPAHSAGRAC